ncbi:anti-sigma factor family protein [Azospira restricta]|uniref:Zf-HC2 domain-containing protein n=1 Tax=Azospira restricta TaxID=404405 RepID=A0A974Y372_9RHOO|nr:zf-HC2 domain-containing protein [Azospira restricta]QRJ63651.1 zf-HC2 domain-containing protein [Azospira restricta]
MAEDRPDEKLPAGHQPDSETLSAWLDGELDAVAQRYVEAHLAVCPACAARIAALRGMAAGFASMREETLGYDLAGVLAGRLAEVAARRPAPRARWPWFAWLPATLGAAASLALGVGLGSALLGGAAVPAAQPALVSALRVFDPMPPGSACLGSDACYPKGMPR